MVTMMMMMMVVVNVMLHQNHQHDHRAVMGPWFPSPFEQYELVVQQEQPKADPLRDEMKRVHHSGTCTWQRVRQTE